MVTWDQNNSFEECDDFRVIRQLEKIQSLDEYVIVYDLTLTQVVDYWRLQSQFLITSLFRVLGTSWSRPGNFRITYKHLAEKFISKLFYRGKCFPYYCCIENLSLESRIDLLWSKNFLLSITEFHSLYIVQLHSLNKTALFGMPSTFIAIVCSIFLWTFQVCVRNIERNFCLHQIERDRGGFHWF